ncbi:hypothetical protein K439DRAFT_1283779, partial [Ramaria rubella]
LVCLNLPLGEHYKVENMHLAGIIPGPNEPSLEHLNHFLAPVVADLLEFWEHDTRTADYLEGRIVHVVIVPVVADLPASCKVHGSAGAMATQFCALCLCKQPTLHGFDPLKWPKRT